jgi:hypothetical protein
MEQGRELASSENRALVRIYSVVQHLDVAGACFYWTINMKFLNKRPDFTSDFLRDLEHRCIIASQSDLLCDVACHIGLGFTVIIIPQNTYIIRERSRNSVAS